jgi:hypothetical protein
MANRAICRERRATRRSLRAALRRRTAANRLVASCRRRPHSLATHLIAAGVDRDTAAGAASGLRSVAKRLHITPAETGRTRRTVHGGRAHRSHDVHRYTTGQVARIAAAYRPRKAEYVVAVQLLTRSAMGVAA